MTDGSQFETMYLGFQETLKLEIDQNPTPLDRWKTKING